MPRELWDALCKALGKKVAKTKTSATGLAGKRLARMLYDLLHIDLNLTLNLPDVSKKYIDDRDDVIFTVNIVHTAEPDTYAIPSHWSVLPPSNTPGFGQKVKYDARRILLSLPPVSREKHRLPEIYISPAAQLKPGVQLPCID